MSSRIRISLAVVTLLLAAAAAVCRFAFPAYEDIVAEAALWSLCSQIAAFLVMYFVSAQGPERLALDRRSLVIGLLITVGAAAALLCFAFRGFLQPGIPVLRHDWQWPLNADQMRAYVTYTTSNWIPEAIGFPKAYPTIYVLAFVWSWLAAGIGSKATLLISIIGSLMLGAAAIYLLACQRFRMNRASGMFAGLFYACAPFVLNKFVAGHVPNVIGYGLLPLLAYLATGVRAAGRRWWWTIWAGAVLVAISAAQIQYLAFDTFVLATIWVSERSGRARVAIFSIAALMLGVAVHAQSIWHLLHPVATLERPLPATLEWLQALSVHPYQLFSFDGYVGNYVQQSIPAALSSAWPLAAAWLLVATAAIALAGRLSRLTAIGAIVLFAGIVGATGTLGPFGVLKTLAFERFLFLNIFREFYNLEVFVAFGCALLLPAALGALRLERFKLAPYALPAIVLLVAGLPVYGGMFAQLVPQWSVPKSYDALSAVTRDGSARIAMLPLISPLIGLGTSSAGSDPFFLPWYERPTMFEWEPSVPVSTAAILLDQGQVDSAARLLGLAGVKWIVARENLRSDLPNFTYPALFSPTWMTNWYYTRLAQNPLFKPVLRTPDYRAYLNPHYVPYVALGTQPVKCPLEQLVAFAKSGSCANGAVPLGVRIPLPSMAQLFDPRVGWVDSREVYFVSPSASLSEGVASAALTPLTVQLRGDAPIASVAVECFSAAGMTVAADGVNIARHFCTSAGLTSHWELLRFSRRRVKAFTFTNEREKISLIAAVVLNPHGRSTFSGVAQSRPIGDADAVTFRRLRPTRYTGTIATEKAAELLLSARYDPRWTLELSNNTTIKPERVNGFENGFPVPAGRYTFQLHFAVGATDRLTWNLQLAAWIVIALLAIVSIVQRVRYRVA